MDQMMPELGLDPLPPAPAMPVPVPPKRNPIADALVMAVAGLAGPGRGTGLLQGWQAAKHQGEQRAQMQAAQDMQRYQIEARLHDQRVQAQQQEAMRRQRLVAQASQDLQAQLENAATDTETERLYQDYGGLLTSQGIRGYTPEDLKRRFKSPDVKARAMKAVDRFFKNDSNKKAWEADPYSAGKVTIDVNGIPVTVAEAMAMAGETRLAPPKAQPTKTTPNLQLKEGMVNGQQAFVNYNPDTGTVEPVKGFAPIPPKPEKAPSAGGLNPYQEFSVAEKLAKAWTDTTKSTREMDRQYNLMQTGLKRFRAGDKNGGSQAVLVTFQKILDPTSVVRESEYARSSEGISLMNRMQGFAERLQSGGAGVTDADLAAMVETARQFVDNMKTYTLGQRSRLEAQVKKYNLDPATVFDDVLTGAPTPGTEPSQGGAVDRARARYRQRNGGAK